MPKLEIRNLFVAFQTRREMVRAVTDVSFQLDDGGSLGLWWHSGCGKSTIIKSILGLPIDGPGWTGGEVFYGDYRVSPEVSRYVTTGSKGMIYKDCMGFFRKHRKLLKPFLGSHWRSTFQEPIYSFDPRLPIGDQASRLLEHLSNDETGSNQYLTDEFESALQKFDLNPSQIRNRVNLELSGGECQRIQLALSIAGRPKLLLADEPTTAIDRDTRMKVNELLKEKMRGEGMGLLIASHNRDELLTLVDRIVVLCKGVVIERMDSKCLTDDSAESFHPYTRKLWFALGDQDAQPCRSMLGTAESSLRGCPFVDECSYPESSADLRGRCRHERPPFFSLADGHDVSCWLFRNNNAETGKTN